jgi:glycosyltransferase involved in cell wall biosynthesis
MEVNWISPIMSPSGYANVNRHLVIALVKLGVKVNLINQKTFDVLTIKDFITDQKEILDNCLCNKINLVYPVVYYTTPHNWNQLKIEGSKYDIVGSMFEVDRIPKEWVEVSQKVKEFWIPSIFNLETYYHSGVDISKLHVMPLGVDTEFYNPVTPDVIIKNKRKFSFILLSQWTYRKGFDTLIAAFIEEFKQEEDVCLIIKTYQGDYSERCNDIVRKDVKSYVGNNRHAPILLYFGQITPEEIRAFYNVGDCFVMPTRGEGWNLPLAEAMACEIPTIVTDWSAHKMFTTSKTSYLINYKLITTEASKLTWIFSGYKDSFCAEPDKEHLKKLMRYVYTHQDEAKQKAKVGRQVLQENFTWKNAARNIIKRLEEIQCMI